MAEITSYTAARMKQIEDSAIVGGHIDGDDLILERFDSGTVNAGDVRGPQGLVGPPGDMGGPGSSTDGTLAVFEGTSGTELREGELEIPNISQRLLESFIYSEIDAGKYDVGGVLSPNWDSTYVFVNSSHALRPRKLSNLIVRVGSGVGWISKNSPANKATRRMGLYQGSEGEGGDLTYVSPGAASFRRAYVLLTFQDDGEIVPSFGYGTASAVDHAGSTLPSITDYNVVVSGIVNITNEEIFSVSDQRNMIGSRITKGTGAPPTNNRVKVGEAYYDTVDKKLLIHSESGVWTPPWNLPWGVVGKALITSNFTWSGSSTVDVSGLSVTFTALGSRRYRFSIAGYTHTSTASPTTMALFVTDSSNTVMAQSNSTATSASQDSPAILIGYKSGLSGSITLKVRVVSTAGGNGTLAASSSSPAWFVVEDIGPA